MATQTDRLARIAAEGFAMIDELYGRPPNRGERNPGAYRRQGPEPPNYNNYMNWNQVPQIAEPVTIGGKEAAKKYGGFMFNNQDGY